MSFSRTGLALASVGLFALAPSAFAQDAYISLSAGLNIQGSSDNEGETGAFTTGNIGDGTTIDVAAGTDYGWETEFDNGFAVAGEIGKRFDNGFRAGLELVYSEADVDTHTDVTLGGGAIGTLDAAALTGSATPLGASIATVVADGQGDISSYGAFANIYYDFAMDSAVSPYVGAGLGLLDTSVEYAPSGVGIIDDGGTDIAYQAKAGLTYRLGNGTEFFGEATYRVGSDVETENDLFPGSLEIENKQTILSAGVRFAFGG